MKTNGQNYTEPNQVPSSERLGIVAGGAVVEVPIPCFKGGITSVIDERDSRMTNSDPILRGIKL